jgi:hypothetical protein
MYQSFLFPFDIKRAPQLSAGPLGGEKQHNLELSVYFDFEAE